MAGLLDMRDGKGSVTKGGKGLFDVIHRAPDSLNTNFK